MSNALSAETYDFIEKFDFLKKSGKIHYITDVAKELDVSQAYLGRILKGKIEISSKIYYKFISVYFSSDNINSNLTTLPFVSATATASFITQYSDESLQHHTIQLPPFSHSKHAFAIEVTGDSMEPTLMHGDILIVSPIQHPTDIINGNVYIVHTHFQSEDQIVCKRLYKHANGIQASSDNPRYSDVILALEHIVHIFVVERLITSNLRLRTADQHDRLSKLERDLDDLKRGLRGLLFDGK